jgi:hypothetical protein
VGGCWSERRWPVVLGRALGVGQGQEIGCVERERETERDMHETEMDGRCVQSQTASC